MRVSALIILRTAILLRDQAQLINNLSSLKDKLSKMHLSFVAMILKFMEIYLWGKKDIFMGFSSSELSIS